MPTKTQAIATLRALGRHADATWVEQWKNVDGVDRCSGAALINRDRTSSTDDHVFFDARGPSQSDITTPPGIPTPMLHVAVVVIACTAPLAGCYQSHEIGGAPARDASLRDATIADGGPGEQFCFGDAPTVVAPDVGCAELVVVASGRIPSPDIIDVEGSPVRIIARPDRLDRTTVGGRYDCEPRGTPLRVWYLRRTDFCARAPYGELTSSPACEPEEFAFRWDSALPARHVAEWRVQGDGVLTVFVCVD